MDLLGVGPLELALILLIVFLVIGPNDLAATGKKIGRFLSSVKKSEFWRGVNQISKEVRTLPNTLMREAELEDLKNDMEKDAKEIRNVSKEFNVDVPDWQKSAQKEVSSSQNAATSAPQPEAEPVPEQEAKPAPTPEAEQATASEEEKE